MISPRFNSVMQGAARYAFIIGAVLALIASNSLAAKSDPPASTAKQTPETSTRDEWSGIYLGADKVGYAQISVEPATYEGKPALKETTHSVLKVLLLGQSMQEDESSITITDLQSRPLKQTMTITS